MCQIGGSWPHPAALMFDVFELERTPEGHQLLRDQLLPMLQDDSITKVACVSTFYSPTPTSTSRLHRRSYHTHIMRFRRILVIMVVISLPSIVGYVLMDDFNHDVTVRTSS